MNNRFKAIVLWIYVFVPSICSTPALGADAEKIRVLIIDGQNNHDWRTTTPHMKTVLEASGRFVVTVATSPQKPTPPTKPKQETAEALAKYKEDLAKYTEADAAFQKTQPFQPDLSKYDVLLSNYNGAPWPVELQKSLETRLQEGKIGLVIIHAANNSFSNWAEYNRMIGMGWRGASAGERLYIDDNGKEVRQPKGEGIGAGHKTGGSWQVVVRKPDHPITKGMPNIWMHAPEELYESMRGPIENVTVLATAYSPATKVHEPMIWTIAYGKGRVFHTPMGHSAQSMRCMGFVTTLRRGTEWAATGTSTLAIPENFPTADKASLLPMEKK